MNKYLYKAISFVSYFTVSALTLIKVFETGKDQQYRQIIILLVILAILNAIVYLALFDLKHYEIPSLVVYILIAFTLGINLLLLVIKGFDAELVLYGSRTYSPSSNIIAALAAGAFFGIVVIATKEKGMGIGDVLIALVMGMKLGIKGTIIAFYNSVCSARIVGLILAVFKKRFRNVALPFVPFMALGIVVSFLFTTEIWEQFIERLFVS